MVAMGMKARPGVQGSGLQLSTASPEGEEHPTWSPHCFLASPLPLELLLQKSPFPSRAGGITKSPQIFFRELPPSPITDLPSNVSVQRMVV